MSDPTLYTFSKGGNILSHTALVFEPNISYSKFQSQLPFLLELSRVYNRCYLLYFSIDHLTHHLLTDSSVTLITFTPSLDFISLLKSTDLLVINHLFSESYSIAQHYLSCLPLGKIYARLNSSELIGFTITPEIEKFLCNCHLVTNNHFEMTTYIRENWSFMLHFIPSGYFNKTLMPLAYEEKENLIVYDISTTLANSYILDLINAFYLLYEKDCTWRLFLIGTPSHSFQTLLIDHALALNSQYLNQITLITDPLSPSEYISILQKAKVFYSTNSDDTTLHHLAEAIYYGVHALAPIENKSLLKKYYGENFSFMPITDFSSIDTKLLDICLNGSSLPTTPSHNPHLLENIKQCLFFTLLLPLKTFKCYEFIWERILIENPSTILDLTQDSELYTYLTLHSLKVTSFPSSITTSLSSLENTLSTLPHFDITILSQLLWHFSKGDGYKLINLLLKYTSKKLIIVIPKYHTNGTKWSYVDFSSYDFSGHTFKWIEEEFFIFSIYPKHLSFIPIDEDFKIFCNLHPYTTLHRAPLKIAFIVSSNYITGGFKILLQQIEGLHQKGHQTVGVIQSDFASSFLPTNHTAPLDQEIILKNSDSLEDYLTDCDVIICGIFEAPKLAYTNLPVLILEQGHQILFGEIIAHNAASEKSVKLYYDRLYKHTPKLFACISHSLSDILTERYGRSNLIILNGIDSKLYYPLKNSTRSKTTTKILLIGSPYIDFKGFDLALLILSDLLVEHFSLEITWITPIPYTPPSNLPIHFVINPTEQILAATIRSQDILLSTSWYESFSLPPLEAMSSGVAVVATDNSGIKTYAQNEYNCLLQAPGDKDGLKVALKRLIEDIDLRDSLIKNGLHTASMFSFDRMISTLERHLYEVSYFYKSLNKNTL